MVRTVKFVRPRSHRVKVVVAAVLGILAGIFILGPLSSWYAPTIRFLWRDLTNSHIHLGDYEVDIDARWIPYEMAKGPIPAVGLVRVRPFARDQNGPKLAIGLSGETWPDQFAEPANVTRHFRWGGVVEKKDDSDRLTGSHPERYFYGYVESENIYLAIITSDIELLQDIRAIRRRSNIN